MAPGGGTATGYASAYLALAHRHRQLSLFGDADDFRRELTTRRIALLSVQPRAYRRHRQPTGTRALYYDD